MNSSSAGQKEVHSRYEGAQSMPKNKDFSEIGNEIFKPQKFKLNGANRRGEF